MRQVAQLAQVRWALAAAAGLVQHQGVGDGAGGGAVAQQVQPAVPATPAAARREGAGRDDALVLLINSQPDQ